jgi:hypothetical protein
LVSGALASGAARGVLRLKCRRRLLRSLSGLLCLTSKLIEPRLLLWGARRGGLAAFLRNLLCPLRRRGVVLGRLLSGLRVTLDALQAVTGSLLLPLRRLICS